MRPRSVRIRLIDIRAEVAGIRDLTQHTTPREFAASWAMRRAVEHALLIVAEAAKHLPEELKVRYPQVPWAKIHGLGNMLRHEYRRIDSDVLWSIITEHLDELDRAVAGMLDSLGEV